MVGAQRCVGVEGLPHVEHRDDVQDGEVTDGFGMVQGEALADEAAAIVAGNCEAVKAESAHQAENVGRHCPLAEVRVR